MNLYKFTSGCYSDYSERWYSHPDRLTKDEFKQLILQHVPAVRAELAKKYQDREEAARRIFGVESADDVGWDYRGAKRVMATPKGTDEDYESFLVDYPLAEDAREIVYLKAGFVPVEAIGCFDEGEQWRWDQQLDEIEREASK